MATAGELSPPARAGALYEAGNRVSAEADDTLAQELGRAAVSVPYLRRFLTDVAGGKTSIKPERAVSAILAWSQVDLFAVSRMLAAGGIGGAVAGMALGRGDNRAIEVLLKACADTGSEAHMAAICGLGEAASLGSVEATQALVGLLDGPNEHARWLAAVQLGRARGRRCARLALEALSGLVRAGNERALACGVLGLAGLQPAARTACLSLFREVAESSASGLRAVARVLNELPARSAWRLCVLCATHADHELRALGADALGSWSREKPSAWRLLRRLLRDAHPSVRSTAARAVIRGMPSAAADLKWRRSAHGERGCDPTSTLVRQLIRDPSALVRAAAAKGLCQGGEQEDVSLLRELAWDRAPLVRRAAVEALARIGDALSVRRACYDREPKVRSAAVTALEPGPREHLYLVQRLIGDADNEVARAAARSLGRHVVFPRGERWEQLVSLCMRGALVEPAAEAFAAVLDRRPTAAAEITWQWPITPTAGAVFARVARTSRDWRVAELARTVARALRGNADLLSAIEDVAQALGALGYESAKQLDWLWGCARCQSCEEIVKAATASRGRGMVAGALLSQAGMAVARAKHARGMVARERAFTDAQVSIEAILEHPVGSLEWCLVRRVALQWKGLIENEIGATFRRDLRVTILSKHVIAQPCTGIAVLLENTGAAVVTGVEVECCDICPPARVALIELGGHREVVVPCHAQEPGRIAVRLRVRYRAGLEAGEAAVDGHVMALRPTPLGPVANPYVVGKPLTGDSAMFFGRRAELASVARAVSSGESGSVVVLVGQRRTGKTSLLKQLAARLSESCLPVFFDVQGMLARNTDEFFRELARPLRSYAETATTGEGTAGALLGAEMVREVAASSPGRLVLLLDEFDDLEEKVRGGRVSAHVFDQLRSLIQHTDNVSVVLCGTHRLEELGGEYWSFLLNMATYQRIGCLSREEAELVLKTPLSGLGVVCDDAATIAAWQLTGGHPYLLQLLGYRLVENCVASGEGAVSFASVTAAAEQIVEQGDIHLRYLWDSADEPGRQVIALLAQQDGGMSEDELQESTRLDYPRLRGAIDRLTASELVTGSPVRYLLRIGLLSRWLHRTDLLYALPDLQPAL